MAKVTITHVSNIGGNPTSAATTLNNNADTLAGAFDNTLSRDGTSPNQMLTNLDMNSNRIINLLDPVALQEPVTKNYALNNFTGANVQDAKDWASLTTSLVDGIDYSSKEYAIGILMRGLAGGGSAKDWANYLGGTVDNTEYSAKKYANDAAASATTAASEAGIATSAANSVASEIGSATVTSAATVDLGAIGARQINILGTSTISSFGSSAAAGMIKWLVFASSCTITHNASTLILAAGRDTTTQNGDVFAFEYEGGNRWREVVFHPGSASDYNQFGAGGTRDLTPENFPSGENQEGKVLSWVPGLKRFAFRHPKLYYGPCALDSSTGNIALTNNTWVPIYTAVPLGSYPTGGFRSGMVQYIPRGRYMMYGQVGISMPTTGCTVYLRVRQGIDETNPSGQPNMAVGNPITVGGGVGTSPSTAGAPFTIPFHATDIQYDGAVDHACEVWVEAYAENATSGAGSALASVGLAANATVSVGEIIRKDGLYG